MAQSPLPGASGDRKGPTDRELDRAAPPIAGGREVRVGLFVLIGLFSFVAVLYLLTDPAMLRGRYFVATELPDAGGIRKGDAVQMRGVNIGRVNRFDLIDETVQIVLEINGRWSIPADSRALLAGTDLLGGRTVEIIPGTSNEPAVEGTVFPGSAAEGVFDLAETIGEEARITLESVQRLMADSAVATVHASIDQLNELLSALTEVTAEQREDLSRLSASLTRSASQVEDLTSREELDRTILRADSAMALFQTTGGSLARASESLESIVSRLQSGEGTLGRLIEDEGLYDRIDATLQEFELLARDLRENPSRYINLRLF